MILSGKNNLYQAYLLKKYDIPCPRYTSYPTVPFWENNITTEDHWKELVKKSFNIYEEEGISLYIHLPFCESLCTYCACNKRITVNHSVEKPYIDSLLKEWKLYLNLFGKKPTIKEIHFGGGTPTFFSADNLAILLSGILKELELCPQPNFSFEAHPGSTTREHLETLYKYGFRRLSVGVQDFDMTVQKAIHRIQSFEETAKVINEAREIGYSSVNADLIYGLPFQTEISITDTINKITKLLPERIAFYSYAHVPWKSKSQRGYSEENLPASEAKRKLFETGCQILTQAGYKEIGMDHFALPNEELFVAMQENKLHRNFMGYTTEPSPLLIGLGCSSISDVSSAFNQNIREVEEYQQAVNAGHFPVHKGHELSEEDLMIRKHILNLMCHMETEFTDEESKTCTIKEAFIRLNELEEDGLVIRRKNQIKITDLGRTFIRNICLCFDARYWQASIQKPTFSQAV